MTSCRRWPILPRLLLAPGRCAHASGERAPAGGRPGAAVRAESDTGQRVALADLRGKVLAVTFIYATCSDTCPILTAKMAEIRRRLGTDFGPRVRFVSITVDPVIDTPEVLRGYAEAHGADAPGWCFLTGTRGEIEEVVRRYGAYAKKSEPAASITSS